MHLPINAAKYFVQKVMLSFAFGSRPLASATRSPSYAQLAAHLPGPITASCSSRSIVTAGTSSFAVSTPLAGWPNIPLHLQRKVLAWSRSPNAEDTVAALPSTAPGSTVDISAASDDVSMQVSDGAPAAFTSNSITSSNRACDGDGSSPAEAAATAVGSGSVPTPSTSASQNGTSADVAASSDAVHSIEAAAAADLAVSSSGDGAVSDNSPEGDCVTAAASAMAADSSAVAAGLDTITAKAAGDMIETVSETASVSNEAESVGGSSPAAEHLMPAEAEEQAAAESLATEAAAAAEAEAGAASSSSGSSDSASAAGGSDVPSSTGSSSSEDLPGSAGPAGVRLMLSSGAAMLPHPDKASRGGEDSFFIADHQAAVGVADGVGGWAEIGVDAGAYARLLMVHAKEAADAAADDVAAGTLSPQAILESAFYRTNVQGSSTACVLVVNGSTLSASNLGDSGFVLVRDGVATFQCPQQQHNFNFPFQLGSAGSMSDQPQAAMLFELELQPGDIVITGSDGLWDNIFAEEAATIASKCRDKGETATTAAQVLCRYARMRASDAKYHSPFSYAAIQAGYVYLGGKMDDITVVVSYVTLPQSKL